MLSKCAKDESEDSIKCETSPLKQAKLAHEEKFVTGCSSSSEAGSEVQNKAGSHVCELTKVLPSSGRSFSGS